MVDDPHAVYMREACRQARLARDADEVPVGAVVVYEGQIIGRGFNHPVGEHDPTAHAELLALRDAARAVGNYRLPGTALYVTVEPCLMCAGALVHARVETLVYGAAEPKAGAVRSVMRALDHPSLNHRIDVIEGVLEEDCRGIIQEFFRSRRADRQRSF